MFDILYLGIAIIYALLTGFVFQQKLSTSAHRYFLFFLLSLLIWHFTLYLYLFVPLGEWLLFIGRLNYAMGPLFTFGLLGFFYAFPSHTLRAKKTETTLWIWTIFLSVISLTTPLIDKNETYMAEVGPVVELGEWYLIYLIHMFAMPLLTLFLGIKKYWNLKGLSKTKFGFSFWIFVPTMLAFVITNGILPMYGVIWQFVYSPVFLAPIALSSAFAMYHYRFFDLPYQSLKIIRAAVLLLIFVSCATFSYYLLDQTILSGHQPINFLVSGLIALMCYQQAEKKLPEFTTSSFRTFRRHLRTLQSEIYFCNNYDELMKNVEQTFLVRLHISSVKILLVRQQQVTANIPIYRKNPAIDQLEKTRRQILVTEEIDLQKDQQNLKDFLNDLEASLCIPLYLEKKILGLFILGSKEDKASYSKEEIEEIMEAKELIELSFINTLLQSDLKEENDLMKKMIREKTKNLRQQNEKIKNLLRQQSDFIAVTAHEFRTPLNIALLQLDDTLESYDHSSQVLEDMKVLEGSLDRLKNLTEELFEVQQYDLNKAGLQASKRDMTAFLRNIADEWKELMRQKSIEFQFETNIKTPLWVEFDEAKMRQVVHNLLTNAQKFTPEHGKIILKLETDDSKVRFLVIDNGRGIPDEDKERVFEKFQTTKVSLGMGIGLGLYICKKIIELHGGRIHVEDTPNGGATFVIGLEKTA